jgi:hypothetical protein
MNNSWLISTINHTNNLVDQTNLAIVWESHLAGTNLAVRKSAPTPGNPRWLMWLPTLDSR